MKCLSIQRYLEEEECLLDGCSVVLDVFCLLGVFFKDLTSSVEVEFTRILFSSVR